jgi:phage minor structural protein
MDYTRVYTPAGVFLDFLQNAKVGYTLKDVPLHTAKFTLPADDPKNALCQMGNEVELFDNGIRVERFRIKSAPDAIYKSGGTITYNCEHVLAYLMGSVLFQYHEIGGTGVYTASCIAYVLARQTVARWALGTCDFAYQYQYSIENDSVLRGLLTIPKQFPVESLWTYDTTASPWLLNLVAPDTEVACELRYARNMKEIRKSVDIEQLVTRLYPLGYGEGVNQLTIKDVNDGVPYLDADTIGTWGVHENIWQDGTFEKADALKARGLAILEEHKNPYISYKAKVVDLSAQTGEPFDRFVPGKLVRVNDQEHGIIFIARITELTKADVKGNPGDAVATIANKPRSAADTIAALASRMSVSELNAQGQTCIYQRDFVGNADKDHPATIPVDIPAECVRINKLRLKLTLVPFRSYSQGAAAGGGGTRTSTNGGGGSSSAGGGEYLSDSGSSGGPRNEGGAMAYTGGIGAPTDTGAGSGNTGSATPGLGGSTATITSTENGGDTGAGSGNTGTPSTANTEGTAPWTSNGGTGNTGGNSNNTGSTTPGSGGGTATVTTYADGTGSHYHGVNSHQHTGASHSHGLNGHTHSGPSHAHQVDTHTHRMNDHTHSIGSHVHTTPDHYHGVNAHQHTGAAHVHGIGSHVHNITTHTHAFDHFHLVSVSITTSDHVHTFPSHSHDVTQPDHTHDNIPGIYEGPTATVAVVSVDGNTVPPEAFNGDEVNLIPYLSKDANGKVLRDTRHIVTITPQAGTGNDNGLSGIDAYVLVMTFVRSQGGGDY